MLRKSGPVPASVVKAKDRDFPRRDREGNCDAALKARDTQTWAYVISSLTAFATRLEADAIGFETIDISQRRVDAGAFGNPVTQLNKIVACFRRESDRAPLQRRALRLGV